MNRRRCGKQEVRDSKAGAWWELGAGYHGAPFVLVGSAGGSKSRQVGPTVKLGDLEGLLRRRNLRRVLQVASLVVLAGLLARARRR